MLPSSRSTRGLSVAKYLSWLSRWRPDRNDRRERSLPNYQQQLPVGIGGERVRAATIELLFDRAEALKRIVSGGCACSGCPGRLTETALTRGGWGFCRDCRCAWKVSSIDGHDYATTIPSPAHVSRQ